MATGVELATAWVHLVPSADGITDNIAKSLGGLDGVGDKAGRGVGKRFVDGFGVAALGSSFGNIAADMFRRLTTYVFGFIGAAGEAADSTQKFAKTLQFAGVDPDVIDGLTKSTQAYADATVYGLGDIRNITAQLASNGVANYGQLAEAAGNLNAVAGGNADTFRSVGMALTQTAGAGKLTTENWNQLANAIPGAAGPLIDALSEAGAFTGNFREEMAKGEITADEFNAALMKLGSDPIAVEAAKSTTTFEGAIGNLEAAVTGGLAIALTALQPTITTVVNGLANFVTGLTAVGPWIQANVGWLAPLSAGLATVAIGVTAVGIAMKVQAAGGLIAFVAGMVPAIASTWAFTAALLANPITWVVVAIGLLVAGLVLLAMNWSTVTAWITAVWNVFITWIVAVMNGFTVWWNTLWTDIGLWVQNVWNGFVAWVMAVWDGFVAWIQAGIAQFSAIWAGTWALIGQTITDIWNGFIAWVQGIWDGFVGWITDGIAVFSAIWSATWDNVGAIIRAIGDGIVSFLTGVWGTIQGGIDGFVTSVQSGVSNVMGFISSIPGKIMGFFSNAGSWLFSAGRDLIGGFIGGIRDMIGGVGKAVSGVMKFVGGFFPHSPAERGPFAGSGWTQLQKSGLAIGEQVGKGLASAKTDFDAKMTWLTAPGQINAPTSSSAGSSNDLQSWSGIKPGDQLMLVVDGGAFAA